MEPVYFQDWHWIKVIRGNWLTRVLDPKSLIVTALWILLLVLASVLYWGDVWRATQWMTAIPQNVFHGHEYWRLWTALFAHEDQGHLLSNSLLFFAFAFLLYGHFGKWLFPGSAIFFGGITNAIVLTTLQPQAELLGISGVVYWMGAVWLTLYSLLESRERIFRRVIKAIGIAIVLFIPETIQPHISYLSHFVGFVLGVTWAFLYYFWNRKKFLQAEVVDWVLD